jgi:two-component system, response regulator PdtaR
MSYRIMIVEDELLVALDLEASLDELGYRPVGIAADAASAMELAELKPALALVDLNLRDGLTGPEIGAALARDHGVRVLFMTANPRLLGDGIAGTVGVLTKPYDIAAVASAVDYVMRRTATPPAQLRLFK